LETNAIVLKLMAFAGIQPVRLAYQPPASSTFLSQQTSHQQPASSIFLSEQTSTSHQPPAKRTGCQVLSSRKWNCCSQHSPISAQSPQKGAVGPTRNLSVFGLFRPKE
jgi:hypothetical protein